MWNVKAEKRRMTVVSIAVCQERAYIVGTSRDNTIGIVGVYSMVVYCMSMLFSSFFCRLSKISSVLHHAQFYLFIY